MHLQGANVYGPLVITYLFLGGAAAGALLTISLWSLALSVKGTSRGPLFHEAFEALGKRVYATGFVMLAFAMTCLLWDLGSPERALLVLLHPHPTVITFGAYTLTFEAATAAVLAAMYLLGKPRLSPPAVMAVEVLCCIGAAATMGYTGVFLYGSGMPAWHSGALVALFVFSSLSAGISAVLLIDWVTRGQALILHAARPLQKWHLLCLAAEAAALMALLAHIANDPGCAAARAALERPDTAAALFVGIGGFGLAVPAALESYSLARMKSRAIPAADAACLIGCFVLRAIVIACGVR